MAIFLTLAGIYGTVMFVVGFAAQCGVETRKDGFGDYLAGALTGVVMLALMPLAFGQIVAHWAGGKDWKPYSRKEPTP